MVTRRSRSPGEDHHQQLRAPLLGRQQQQQRPPPPPPPPMINDNNNSTAVDDNNNDAVDIDAGSNVSNATNNNVESAVQPPVAMMNANNNRGDNNVDIQYLQARVPPPPPPTLSSNTSLLRPFHIHRRKNYFARSSAPAHNQSSSSSSSTLSKRRGGDNNNSGNSRKSMPNNTSISKQQQQQQQRPSYADGEIVRILIPPNGFTSERQLADCLSQAAGEVITTTENDGSGGGGGGGRVDFDEYNDDASWDSMDEYYDSNYSSKLHLQKQRVSGMFRESDRVFIPLSVIYSNPISFVGDVLSLKRPPPPVTRRPVPSPTTTHVVTAQRSIFIQFLEMFGIIAVACVSWWSYSAATRVDWGDFLDTMVTKFEVFLWGIVSLPFWLFDVFIEFPLREVYRYGPSVVGWEGEPLPRICAQITYTGDEGFWSRNIEECERIYRAKEDAALLFRKPLLVLVIIVAVFYMVKSIVEARALRRRERIDPNMVETFRAINMLSRQLRRAMNTR